MENTAQNRFKPLSSNAIDNPVLFLNTDAPRLEILDAANLRLSAAKDLIGTIACMTIQDAPDNALVTVCQAAHLLLSDARDLFMVGVYRGDNDD